METITLTNGKVVLVDEDDYERLSLMRWSEAGNGYAATSISNKTVYMHRLVMDAPSGKEVDHVNRNKLDNRKSNLRICTSTQNKLNVGIRRCNTTGFIGVTWHKKANKYQARIMLNGKKTHLGLFLFAKDAALAYNEVAKKEYGDFAELNKV